MKTGKFPAALPAAVLCRECQRSMIPWLPPGRRRRQYCKVCCPSLPLPDKLVEARHQRGLPLEWAAMLADVGPHNLAMAEIGRAPLQVDELRRLAGVYLIDPRKFGVKGGAP